MTGKVGNMFDWIGTATTLVFAIPLAIAGADIAWSGNVITGSALLVAAGGMVAVNKYVAGPKQIIMSMIKREATSKAKNETEGDKKDD